VLVQWSVRAPGYPGGSTVRNSRIKRDGNELVLGRDSGAWLDSPGAGGHTYTVEVQGASDVGSPTYVDGSTLILLEAKR
jgi:hypothetical protein